MFKDFILGRVRRLAGKCPACGSSKISVKSSKLIPLVTDGPEKQTFRCRDCHHEWTILLPTGI